MFGAIAPWYDALNHLLSLNLDKSWRRRTVRLVPPETDEPILDVCTGTGDLALAYDRASGGRVPIVGIDFCPELLRRAVAKAQRAGAADRLFFLEADAQQIPLASDQFQITCVAFGLRNITDMDRGLSEMVRVTRPGGRLVVLEFSRPRHPLLRPSYLFFFRRILPRIGNLLSRSPDSAYSYLPESVLQFPDYEELAARLTAQGLQDVVFHPFTGGIATLYVGRKP
jgi:demethylmenaquinone methyltransferase/2-methoxy-6-polyprenyl-1,4-benzoquinol methylase